MILQVTGDQCVLLIVFIQGGPGAEVERCLIISAEIMEQMAACGRDLQQLRISNDVLRK